MLIIRRCLTRNYANVNAANGKFMCPRRKEEKTRLTDSSIVGKSLELSVVRLELLLRRNWIESQSLLLANSLIMRIGSSKRVPIKITRIITTSIDNER